MAMPSSLKIVFRVLLFVLIIVLVLIMFSLRLFNKGDKNISTSDIANNAIKNSKTFTHSQIGFTFDYPKDYSLSQMTENSKEVILLEKGDSGLQIDIKDFTVLPNINASIVKEQLEGTVLKSLKDITLANGQPAVSFFYFNQSLGEIYNVWFVHGKKLFQVSAFSDQQAVMTDLVNSWQFN